MATMVAATAAAGTGDNVDDDRDGHGDGHVVGSVCVCGGRARWLRQHPENSQAAARQRRPLTHTRLVCCTAHPALDSFLFQQFHVGCLRCCVLIKNDRDCMRGEIAYLMECCNIVAGRVSNHAAFVRDFRAAYICQENLSARCTMKHLLCYNIAMDVCVGLYITASSVL